MGSKSFVGMNEESTVTAQFASPPFDVDDFNNAAWDLATPVVIRHLWSGKPASRERHAEVRLIWTKSGLHARFVCEQHEPLVIADNPVTDRKTLGLWDRDVCEIFLAPDQDNPSVYYEFEGAPTGEWVDLALEIKSFGRATEWDYSSEMKTAAKVEPSQVTLGITVPWSTRIPRPEPGDVWRANLFRCVGSEAKERYLAWRPTRTFEPNFHVPEAFGWLRFE